MSSTRPTARGTAPVARTLPSTFRRRVARSRPRWRSRGLVRRRTSAVGRLHACDRATASPLGGTSPRARARSGSPGTWTSASTSGRGTPSTTNSLASRASRRRPCSFQARTNRRARPSYTIAARARAKASRRPLHSAQRRTGHGPGAPHRSQSGGRSFVSPPRQRSQSARPGRSHTAQRSGSSASSRRTPRR